MNFLSLGAFFIVVLLVFAAAGIVVFIAYATIIGSSMGAPFVRSKKEKIARMIECVNITAQDMVVDLGSGDGSLVIAAARPDTSGRAAIGVEMNPLLVWYSRMRIQRAGLGGRVRIIRRNFYDFPLHEADVLLLYLLPSTVKKLREKMERELKPGARVASHAFPIPGWTPVRQENGVFLYHFRGRDAL